MATERLIVVGNIYPVQYSRAFYEGMKAAGQERVVNLVRCCWAGSQKYGALLVSHGASLNSRLRLPHHMT